MFKHNCRRIKYDKGADAWDKFKDITYPYLGHHIPQKINMEFAKVRRMIFLAKIIIFQMKKKKK